LDAGRCSREEEGERRDGCPPIDDSSVSKLLKAAVPEGTSRGGGPPQRGGRAGGKSRGEDGAPEGRSLGGGAGHAGCSAAPVACP